DDGKRAGRADLTSTSRRTTLARGVRHSSHACPRHGATHAVATRPSNAEEARHPGRPWKRPEPDSTAPPDTPPASRSTTGSGASGETVTHASVRHDRATGGAKTRSSPVSGYCAVRTR